MAKTTATKPEKVKIDPAVAKVIKDSAKINTNTPRGRDVEITHDAVMKTLSEFLDSFIVIAYDFDGNPVTLSYSTDCKSYTALKTLLYDFADVLEDEP